MIRITPPNISPRLFQKIQSAQSEDDAYAADELVELGEEILSHLAARGFAAYLQQAKQKSVFNDFLISLFLSNGHAYNAGPLYRWAANMLKEAEGEEAALLKPFFWEEKDGKQVLNEVIHSLASLRNAVMHGFFVLPPERNRVEAMKMEDILGQMRQAGLFEMQFGTFHFMDAQGFNGHWNVTDPAAWRSFDENFAFGKLAVRVAHEYSPGFNEDEKLFATSTFSNDLALVEKANELLAKRKGALMAWYRPGQEKGVAAYRQLVQNLDTKYYHPLYFRLHPNGATFTAAFLEKELAKVLFELTSDEKASKDPLKYLKANNSKLSKQVVVVLHDLHIGLFSPNHITQIFNSLYDAAVPVLATAWNYPYLKRFCNTSINLMSEDISFSVEDIHFSLTNYLRFKGPNAEQANEAEAFELLKEIVVKIHGQLAVNQQVVARRFADVHNYPIEYVHEAFGILSPFYQTKKEPFILDEVDGLYGSPKTIEESTRIFLSLGRRDLKLEYQHRVISNIQ